jgi:hypothetical protein
MTTKFTVTNYFGGCPECGRNDAPSIRKQTTANAQAWLAGRSPRPRGLRPRMVRLAPRLSGADHRGSPPMEAAAVTVREMELNDLLAELEDALATLAQCRSSKGDSILTPLEFAVIRAALTRRRLHRGTRRA